MLILVAATVTIALNGGLFKSAKEARKSYQTESLKESIYVVLQERKMERETGATLPELKDDLEKIEGATVTKAGADVYYVTKDGITITVYEDESIIEGKVSVWDGETSSVPEIKELNWYIYDASQFKFFGDFVNNDNSLTEEQTQQVTQAGYKAEDFVITENTTVYLMADIDLGARQSEGKLTSGKAWTPIGKSSSSHFVGTFEGNNHTISGVYILHASDSNNMIGLFSYSSNTIQNLTIKNSYLRSTGQYVGGIVGRETKGNIINCHNINTTVIADKGYVGGIVYRADGTLLNCSNNGIVKGTQYVAGVVSLVNSTGIINNCTNLGNITGSKYCGGVVAYSKGKLMECTNGSDVNVTSQCAGGVVGVVSQGGKCISCVNYGSVGGGYKVGGVCRSSICFGCEKMF